MKTVQALINQMQQAQRSYPEMVERVFECLINALDEALVRDARLGARGFVIDRRQGLMHIQDHFLALLEATRKHDVSFYPTAIAGLERLLDTADDAAQRVLGAAARLEAATSAATKSAQAVEDERLRVDIARVNGLLRTLETQVETVNALASGVRAATDPQKQRVDITVRFMTTDQGVTMTDASRHIPSEPVEIPESVLEASDSIMPAAEVITSAEPVTSGGSPHDTYFEKVPAAPRKPTRARTYKPRIDPRERIIRLLRKEGGYEVNSGHLSQVTQWEDGQQALEKMIEDGEIEVTIGRNGWTKGRKGTKYSFTKKFHEKYYGEPPLEGTCREDSRT